MRSLLPGVIAVLCGGCLSSGALGDYAEPDAEAQAPDASASPDVTTTDVSVATDVTTTDVSAPLDAAAQPDASAPRDATAARDVAPAPDVTAARDVAPVPDVPTTPPPVMPPSGITVAPALGQLTARQVPTIAPSGGLKAFPGAEGFGSVATGGRGGRVIYVTTLAASGPGSLTEALNATGPRYVLFKVSGFINASIRIAQNDVTLAGQTSPGGVTVRGLRTDEAVFCDSNCGAGVRGVDNVIVRHMRTRPGPINGGVDGLIDGDGLRIRHSRRVIVDHVSTENAVDESVEISYSNNVTVQDSILGETVGGHASLGGMLVNYSNPAAGYQLDALSVIRTAWVRVEGRYPELSRQSAAAANSTMRVELANNLIWDQRFYVSAAYTNGTDSSDGSPVYYRMNWVGNVGYARPGFPYGMLYFSNPSGMSTVFFHDDRLSVTDRTDWQLNYCCNDFAVTPPPARAPSWAVTARHDFPAVTYMPSSDVRAYVVAHAGAFPRDPMDRRLIGYVASGVIPSATPSSNPANDARANDWGSSPPAPPADADNDGMPDAWERAHGLNPAAQDHNNLNVGMSMPGMAGYTNLEVYLAELAEQRLTEGRWGN